MLMLTWPCRISFKIVINTVMVLNLMIGAQAAPQEDPSVDDAMEQNQLVLETPDAPVLAEESAMKIAGLEEEIEIFTESGRYREAIPLAEEVLDLRTLHQSGWFDVHGEAADWFEVVDARNRLAKLRKLSTLTPEEHEELKSADALESEIRVMREQKRRAEAVSLQERQLDIYGRLLGKDAVRTIGSTKAMAVLLAEAGENARAEEYYHRTIQECRRVLGSEHPLTFQVLDYLGDFLKDHQKWSEAESYLLEAMERRRHLLGNHHPDTLTSLLNLGCYYKDRGKFPEGEKYFRECLEGRRRILGDDNPKTLEAIGFLGLVLKYQDRWGEAEKLYHEKLEASRRVLGKDHSDTITALINMAIFLTGQAKYSEADEYYHEALDACYRVLGEDHGCTFAANQNMAVHLYAQGKLAQAEPYFITAMEGSRRNLGAEHPGTLTAIHNLGHLSEAQGKLDEAENYFREVLSLRRRIMGNDHPHTLSTIMGLGALLKKQGRFSEAERYYLEAIEGNRRVWGADHQQTYLVLDNMGLLLEAQGRCAEAERYMREAVDGLKRSLGPDHPDTLIACGNMGFLLAVEGRLAEAEKYYRESLDGFKRLVGNRHSRTLLGFSNMGSLLGEQGRYEEGEEYAREAVAGFKGLLGPDHIETLISLCNLAHLLHLQKRFAESEEIFRDALAGLRRTMGDDHPRTLSTIFNLACLLYDQDDYLQAERYYREALSIAEGLRTREASEERMRAWFAQKIVLSEISSDLAKLLIKEDRLAEAFEVSEKGRSRALLDLLARSETDLVDEARKEAENSGDRGAIPALEKALREEDQAQVELATAEVRLSHIHKQRASLDKHSDMSRTEKKDRLSELDGQIAGQMEKIQDSRKMLTEAGSKVLLEIQSLFPEARSLHNEELMEGLCEGELVLGYIWREEVIFILGAFKGTEETQGGNSQPSVVFLGRLLARGKEQVSGVERLALRVKESISEQPKDLSQGWEEDARVLMKWLIPGALREQLREASRLIILPDGPLHGIAFEIFASISVDDDPFGHDPQFVYAGSATMYLNRRAWASTRSLTQEASALVLGDPMFNPDEDSENHARNEEWVAMRSSGDEESPASVSALDQVRLHGGILEPLDGTNLEACAIAHLFQQRGGRAELLLGSDASLSKLEKNVFGKKYVHLATHGLTGCEKKPYDASLALAQPVIPTQEDTGFLTLDHLIRKWRGVLKDCELVVLSACDTQRGIKAGGSVMALPWGFMYAGAPAVVASLWKVDDIATALLMQRFYANLLGHFEHPRYGYEPGKAMQKADALQEAKYWLQSLTLEEAMKLTNHLPPGRHRGEVRSKLQSPVVPQRLQPFAHPFFWASFILIGDPE